jgi:GTP cyclohydrolase I
VGFLVGCDSPNQLGVTRLDSEVVWIFTEPSAILVIPTSLVRTVVFFLFKEAHFYANWLLVTSRCASRGFFGHAYIGYLPHTSIIGISKLTRLVRLFARRFTVQERLGEQIVHTCDAMLEPHGVAVYLQANHLCVEMRGVRDTSPLTQMTVWRGEYEHNAALRVEFLLACGAER